MEYEWDANKAQSNRQKHGIDFADAVSVFGDNFAITVIDEHPDEQRFATIGMDAMSRIIVVVYTLRAGSCIRLISARKATKRERQQYEEEA
ncbi:MAG: BrnT family toxin [Rivularia sp. (in: cyanobacteria)]